MKTKMPELDKWSQKYQSQISGVKSQIRSNGVKDVRVGQMHLMDSHPSLKCQSQIRIHSLECRNKSQISSRLVGATRRGETLVF